MKDPRKAPYRQAPQMVPEELLRKKHQCESCGNVMDIPWLDELPFPLQPIPHDSGTGHFVPASFPIKCDNANCRVTNNKIIPQLDLECDWTLYGDEAGRYIRSPHPEISKKPLNFFCITLVGLHKDVYVAFREEFRELKRFARPGYDPDAWVHHFTKIWSSRSDSEKFSFKSKQDKVEYGLQLARLIRDYRPSLVSFTISNCISVPKNKADRKKHIKHQKQTIFSQSIISTLLHMRLFKKGVYWVFDNIKDATGKSAPTEGWASECFRGLQYTRLFTWLSGGSKALEPDFVSPGSHILLEIADFISYCVAREFEMAATKNTAELPTSLFGKAFYQGTKANGSSYYKWDTKFPIMEYYGIQPS